MSKETSFPTVPNRAQKLRSKDSNYDCKTNKPELTTPCQSEVEAIRDDIEDFESGTIHFHFREIGKVHGVRPGPLGTPVTAALCHPEKLLDEEPARVSPTYKAFKTAARNAVLLYTNVCCGTFSKQVMGMPVKQRAERVCQLTQAACMRITGQQAVGSSSSSSREQAASTNWALGLAFDTGLLGAHLPDVAHMLPHNTPGCVAWWQKAVAAYIRQVCVAVNSLFRFHTKFCSCAGLHA